MVARIGHDARRVSVCCVLRHVVPHSAGVTGWGAWVGWLGIGVVVYILEAVRRMDRLGPRPLPLPAVVARQCGATTTSVAGWVGRGHSVARLSATRGLCACSRGGGWRRGHDLVGGGVVRMGSRTVTVRV